MILKEEFMIFSSLESANTEVNYLINKEYTPFRVSVKINTSWTELVKMGAVKVATLDQIN